MYRKEEEATKQLGTFYWSVAALEARKKKNKSPVFLSL